jgi:hypothetical protein
MTTKKHYENQVRNKIQKIESLQMKMNKNLHKPILCNKIEKQQSFLRVEIMFLKRKIEAIELRLNKAA